MVESGSGWDLANSEDALKHLEADEGFQEFFIGEIDGDVFAAGGEQGLKFGEPAFREDDGLDGEMTFEQALDDFVTFGDEDALGGVISGTAKGAVRGEFGRVEGGDGLEAEHAGNLNNEEGRVKNEEKYGFRHEMPNFRFQILIKFQIRKSKS